MNLAEVLFYLFCFVVLMIIITFVWFWWETTHSKPKSKNIK